MGRAGARPGFCHAGPSLREAVIALACLAFA